MSRALSDETPVNAEALYDYLNCLRMAVLCAESGDRLAVAPVIRSASSAALMAVPVGSPESRALGLILAAAERVSAEVIP
jgi:putative Ca2+/H+ antiporter (TMEM165/GDT1 family)